MTLDEFILKYTGQLVDWDHFYGGQCMDLYRQYCNDVLNFPQSPSVPGAKDVWNNYLTDCFERILNIPSAIPEQGDVVIWGNGEYGHIAIFVDGDVNKFNSFDQNFPVGSKCHLQTHTYTGVLGWLRPLKVVDQSLTWLKGMFMEQGIDLGKPEGDVRARVQEVFDGWKKYAELEKRLQKAERDLAGAKAEGADFEQRLITAEGTIKRLNDETADLKASIASRDVELGALKVQVDSLKAQLDPDKVIVVAKDEYFKLVEAKEKILEVVDIRDLLGALLRKIFRKGAK